MELAWDGLRALRVREKIAECPGVWSFVLAPEDGQPLPPFQPGQYLTFSLQIPGEERAAVRCYSLSDAPHPDSYRITVKRILPRPGAGGRPGLASSYLAQDVRVGDVLQARAPAGRFTLDPRATTPLVLIGGGVGITPLLSMLNALAGQGMPRETWLFLGMRNEREHPFRRDVAALESAHEDLHVRLAYSKPGTSRVERRPGRFRGRLTIETIKRELPPGAEPYDFYVCGPAPMMDALSEGLAELGVPRSKIHLEAFGAATVKPLTRRFSRRVASGVDVTFARAGKTVAWDPAAGSLLDFAMANDVFFPFACAAGHCGTCTAKLVAGTVEYPSLEPQFPIRAGMCLPCIAVPTASVTLDL